MDMLENVGTLVDDYRSFLGNADASTESVEGVLIREGDWSPRAAEHLLQLVKHYGSFMLRNALAISLVLEIEDGDLGF